MLEVNIREARCHFGELLNRVEKGEKVILTRRGKRVARLLPLELEERLPSLEEFRRSIVIKGKTMSQTVVDSRLEERY